MVAHPKQLKQQQKTKKNKHSSPIPYNKPFSECILDKSMVTENERLTTELL